MRAAEDRCGEAGNLVDRRGETASPPDVVRGDTAKSVRSEDGQVRRRGDREQRLVRADVRHRLLPADVLLARLQGHAKGPVTVRVASGADDQPRPLAAAFLPAGDEPEQR